MPPEIVTALPPELLAALPPEIVSVLAILTPSMLIFLSLLISVPFALTAYLVARKRGLRVRYWTMLGLILGPFVLPFLLFAKKKKLRQ